MRRWSAAVCVLLLGVAAALTVGTPALADGSAPAIVAWSVTSTPGCGCVDFTVEIDSAYATVHLDWGTTQSLGSSSNDLSIFGSAVHTLRWTNPPPAGSYYIALVATNSTGSTITPLLGLTIDASGGVSTFIPPSTRPPPPTLPRYELIVDVAPSTPVVMVAGDSIAFRVGLRANDYWSPSMPPTMSITLPGNQYAGSASSNDKFDFIPGAPTTGACSYGFYCDFGSLSPGQEAFVSFRLNAKVAGNYQLTITPWAGDKLVVPITVAPRQADLHLRPTSPIRIIVGRRTTTRVVITNKGPNVAADSTITVGQPRPLQLHVSVGGKACSAPPIRCPIPDLAPGASIPVIITASASRAGTARIPIGISSQGSIDINASDNTTSLQATAARHAAR